MIARSLEKLPLPGEPYRGLEPYRFCDQAIFFERETEAERLLRLVTMYRGSLLYGESGAGKSSLINAGFLPKVIKAGMSVERLRVRPRRDHEFVVERIPRSDVTDDVLPSILVGAEANGPTTIGAASFLRKASNAAAADADVLLIFDQFEELLTLTTEFTDSQQALESQGRILDSIVALLQDRALHRIRLLFVFREDYLAKFDRLFYLCPELTDRFMRLTPPPASALSRLIRGPFESDCMPQGHWARVIPTAVADELERRLRPVEEGRGVNLSQVQIAALELWRATDPAAMLADRGVNGLVQNFLHGQLAAFGPHRESAEVILSLMITREGTRKIVTESEAIDEIQRERRRSAVDARIVLIDW